jgi:hypothetical protein
MEEVYVPKSPHEKAMQRALIQYRNPKNYDLVVEALQKAGRADLIGFDKKCLVRPRQLSKEKHWIEKDKRETGKSAYSNDRQGTEKKVYSKDQYDTGKSAYSKERQNAGKSVYSKERQGAASKRSGFSDVRYGKAANYQENSKESRNNISEKPGYSKNSDYSKNAGYSKKSDHSRNDGYSKGSNFSKTAGSSKNSDPSKNISASKNASPSKNSSYSRTTGHSKENNTAGSHSNLKEYSDRAKSKPVYSDSKSGSGTKQNKQGNKPARPKK